MKRLARMSMTSVPVSLHSSALVCWLCAMSLIRYPHQVNLGQDTNRSCSFQVNFVGHLKTIGIGQVSVGRGDCEDYASRLGDIFEEHIMNLFLNVFAVTPANTDLANSNGLKMA